MGHASTAGARKPASAKKKAAAARDLKHAAQAAHAKAEEAPPAAAEQPPARVAPARLSDVAELRQRARRAAVAAVGLLEDGALLFVGARLAAAARGALPSCAAHAELRRRVGEALRAEHDEAAGFEVRLAAVPRRERDAMEHYFCKRRHWLCHLSQKELCRWFSSGGYEAPSFGAIGDRQRAVAERRGRIAALQAGLAEVQALLLEEMRAAGCIASLPH